MFNQYKLRISISSDSTVNMRLISVDTNTVVEDISIATSANFLYSLKTSVTLKTIQEIVSKTCLVDQVIYVNKSSTHVKVMLLINVPEDYRGNVLPPVIKNLLESLKTV